MSIEDVKGGRTFEDGGRGQGRVKNVKKAPKIFREGETHLQMIQQGFLHVQRVSQGW
jgi:hypothetical protein